MKILRIIARLNVGGPARHVVWLTEGLRAMGCETTLVTGVVPPGEDDMGYLASAAGAVPIVVPEMSREISLKDAIAIWKLYRIMRRERPDIVHTHTAKAGTVGRTAGLMYRYLTPAALIGNPRACKFVHTYHGHVFHSYYGRWRTKIILTIERVLARVATDRIIVLTEQQRREINEKFRVGKPEQFAVIPLGIDLVAFAKWRERGRRLREELQVGARTLVIGIVGRLTEVKNHKLFLESIARLMKIRSERATQLPQSNNPGLRFWIIGDGHLRAEVEKLCLDLGLSHVVDFLGSRTDPEEFYPALDLVALTSLNEGTPLTLIEAMANERAVIATAVGGVPDLLGNCQGDLNGFSLCERGVSVRSGDADAFARALNHLVEFPSLPQGLGQAGREFVSKNYSKGRLLRDVHQLYEQLLATSKTEPAHDPVERASRREIASH